VSSSPSLSDANSHLIAIVLMLVILFAFAALVLAMLMMFASFSLGGGEEEVPAIFKITSITHDGDSIVVLSHTGPVTYNNSNLMAKFYKDDKLLHCDILTLNGHDFISTVHHGVKTMSGAGCKGSTWLPNERIALDFSDGTLRPDDMVMAEIYDTTTGLIISRHSFRV
jgi:hypothetical protein